jgi:hypothetical protein
MTAKKLAEFMVRKLDARGVSGSLNRPLNGIYGYRLQLSFKESSSPVQIDVFVKKNGRPSSFQWVGKNHSNPSLKAMFEEIWCEALRQQSSRQETPLSDTVSSEKALPRDLRLWQGRLEYAEKLAKQAVAQVKYHRNTELDWGPLHDAIAELAHAMDHRSPNPETPEGWAQLADDLVLEVQSQLFKENKCIDC